jgi:hypothetical protein
VTVISCLIAAAGALGLAYHLTELNLQHPLQNDVVWVSLVRVVAIVSGVYMFRGRNWARWLAMAWIGFHVVIGGFHSRQQMAMHSLLFVVFAYVLFRRPAQGYFGTATSD